MNLIREIEPMGSWCFIHLAGPVM